MNEQETVLLVIVPFKGTRVSGPESKLGLMHGEANDADINPLRICISNIPPNELKRR